MKIKLLLSVFLLGLLFTGCSPKVYFTNDIRNRIEGANISLKNIQYYNDKKVVLKRELESGTTKVESGKVKLENGKYIHYIILKPKTPGVCKNIYTDKLSIAFELGSDNTLDFGKSKKDSDNTPYQIFAIEWDNNIGKVKYEGKYYYIQREGSSAKLMIKKSVLSKIDIEKRRMKGVRID